MTVLGELLVPVPKKEDLSFCDNLQGISLLDAMGNLSARVINDSATGGQ